MGVDLVDITAKRAALTPQRIAFEDAMTGRTLTYAALEDRCARAAAVLASLGVVRDDRVAIEQGRGEDPASHRQHTPARIARHPMGKGRQGQHPALPLVVEPQHDAHVFHRDDQRHRPEKGRQGRQHIALRGVDPVRSGKRFLERVQRTRADVAIDDPQRREAQGQQARPGMTGWITHR